MQPSLRITSHILTVVGLLGSAAAFLLAHLARTRMGVMRDLYVRNEPFMVILNAPVAHWMLRLMILGCSLFFLCSIRRTPLPALGGIIAITSWLIVSFLPNLLGLATPWMLFALILVIAGCLGQLISCLGPKDKISKSSRHIS